MKYKQICHYRILLREKYQTGAVEAISEDDWLHTENGVMRTFDKSDGVIDLRHNAQRNVSKFERNSVVFNFVVFINKLRSKVWVRYRAS